MNETPSPLFATLGSDCKFSEASIDAETSTKLLAINYARMRLAVMLTILVTGVFFGLMGVFFPHDLAIAWACVILLTATTRHFLNWICVRFDPHLIAARRWAALSVAGGCAAGASWAFGPLMMMPPTGSNATMLLVVTLLSVSAVAVTALSAHLATMMGFIATSLFPTAAALYLSGGAIERTTACAVSAAAIMLMLVGRNAHHAIRSLVRTELRLSHTVGQLKIAHGRAEAASIAKTRFLSNMSHELRTPLNAVIGAAQLLQSIRTPVDGEQHLIDSIKQGGSNLLSLIEGILDLSRIEAGALQVSAQDFNLIESIEGTVASVSVMARLKGLTILCIVAPEVVAWRHGDSTLLRQVLLNLLGNAVKFTAHGEVIVRVTCGPGADAICISVWDTGMGIPASELEQVFEPFNQLDAGTNRRFGGSGLGLTISRELIEAMGGRLGVRSQLGAGSCFEINLDLPVALDPVTAAPSLQHKIAYFEPHELSAEALQAQLMRLGCAFYRCHTQDDLRDWLIQQAEGSTNPWVLINCDAPAGQTLLDGCANWLEPNHVIGVTNSDSHGAVSNCQYLHLSRHIVKPVLRAALVSRLGSSSPSVTGAATLRQSALGLATAGSPKGKHVLVVEDDLLNQTIVCKLLTHAGYRVSVAADGMSALEAVSHTTFDLVLMDWHMPDMDGLEVTRRMRGGDAGHWGEIVPIVALTANAFAEDRATCLAAGMNDYLTKPVMADNLFAVIARWTSGLEGEAVSETRRASATLTPLAFDPTVLAALPMVADGSEPEQVEEILDLYLDRTRRALATIDEAARRGDTKSLLFSAHQLKSSSASVGAMALAESAERQEHRLRTGEAPESEWPIHLRERYNQFEYALACRREAKDSITYQ